MGNRFDAKHAFAFAIDLQSQLATVQLEDRQIIGRSLDRDFPFGRSLGPSAIFWAMPVSENRLDGFQVQWRAAAVDERLKDLVHVSAHLEDEVSAEFDLIVRVLITEPAALLLVEVEREAHTGVNPTLTDLAQSPYSPVFGQGLCDLRQTCGVRDSSKAVSVLGEGDARLARLAGNVLMAVQDHLGGEGRMPADLDGQMAPVRVEDVKRVVVHIGHRFLSFDVVFCADIPHRRLRPTDQNQKQALGDCRLGEIFFRNVMLALPDRTVDHRNSVRLGVTANATAEPAGQPHQVGVFERLIRSSQCPPPHPEPTRIMAHAEVSVQNNAIDAIVATAQQILIERAQPVCHRGQLTGTLPPASNCPAGATFSQLSLGKSVEPSEPFSLVSGFWNPGTCARAALSGDQYAGLTPPLSNLLTLWSKRAEFGVNPAPSSIPLGGLSFGFPPAAPLIRSRSAFSRSRTMRRE